MKLITFRYKNSESDELGILSADGSRVAPLAAFGFQYKDMTELINKITPSEMALLKAKSEEADQFTDSLSKVTLLAPIPHPRQDVICLGLNYAAHAEEAERFNDDNLVNKTKTYPVYFSKRCTYATADGDGIPAYEGLVDSLDYEAELAVIIGKTAKNVAPEDASKYIFGYTICNDVSARNLQTRHTQWYMGKGLDGYTPMGPALVTADEIAYPPALRISSTVNGELRQDANTNMLLFNIDRIISELSAGMTLLPGTIIITGTPKGVGMGFDPPRFLKKGDVVTCSIEKIGTLTNTVID